MLRWLTPPRNDARLVFENGKFLQSYGKDQGGKPITIGYDSKNQQYFGFTNKGSSNSGSIYDAISASSNGKYSADILRGVVQPIPVADTTPPKPPSQPTPQPKPLSQSELSAAQFLVDTLTADKRQLQAKENEYHRNILQIAKQNMHDSAVRKFARDEALMQQAYAIGGESYLPLKRVELGWQVKNLKDVFQNSLNLVIDPKYGGNLPLAVFSTSGDLIDCGMQQIVHVISGVEGGADTLKVLGYLPNKLIGTVKDFSKDIAKEHLPEKWYKGLSDWYKGLPENTKVTATLAADSMVLWGAGRVLQIASGPATSKLYSALEKGVTAEASAFTTVGKASEIGLVGENTITKPSSMLTKVELKLQVAELGELSENVGKIEHKNIWSERPDITTTENAFSHWKGHGKNFTDIYNAKQYVEFAKNFIDQPPLGTLKYIRQNGEKIFYHPESNVFIATTIDGTPKTMMKPRDKIKYFEKQIIKDKE